MSYYFYVLINNFLHVLRESKAKPFAAITIVPCASTSYSHFVHVPDMVV